MRTLRDTAIRTWVLLLALAAGCGQGSGPSIAPADFCARFAAASCGSDVRCAPGTVQSDLQSCIATATAQCGLNVNPDALTAIAQGRLQWRGDQARQCVDLLDGACANRELFTQTPTACNRLWAGAVGAGGACGATAQSDSFPTPTEQCAAGTCVCGACPPVSAPGSLCPRGSSTVCPVGEECLFDDATLQDRCAPPPAKPVPSPQGGPCSYQSELSNSGTSISLGQPCQPGLVCIVDGGVGSGTCQLPRAAGQPCQRIRECAPGLACLSSGSCGPARGQGEPCAPPVKESNVTLFSGLGGQEPGPVWTGEGGDCAAGLVCSGGTCRARPGQVGAACDCEPGSPSGDCAAGACFGANLRCDVTGLCALSALGSACASGGVCPTGSFCNCGSGRGPFPFQPCPAGTSGQCEALREDGAACVSFEQCRSSHCDAAGVCTSTGQTPEGSPCTFGADCISGVCDGASGTCRARCG